MHVLPKMSCLCHFSFDLFHCPSQDKLAYFRIKELKDILHQLGLPKQGKKQVGKCCCSLNYFLHFVSPSLWSLFSTIWWPHGVTSFAGCSLYFIIQNLVIPKGTWDWEHVLVSRMIIVDIKKIQNTHKCICWNIWCTQFYAKICPFTFLKNIHIWLLHHPSYIVCVAHKWYHTHAWEFQIKSSWFKLFKPLISTESILCRICPLNNAINFIFSLSNSVSSSGHRILLTGYWHCYQMSKVCMSVVCISLICIFIDCILHFHEIALHFILC